MTRPLIGITGCADHSSRPPNTPIIALARTYVRAVSLARGAPVIIPPHLGELALRSAFERIDGLILSGGGDIHPSSFGEEDRGLLWRVDQKRDRTELTLARWALSKRLPVLAICRGLQTLNVAAGGTLIQDIPTEVPGALSHSGVAGRPLAEVSHAVRIEPDSRLADLIGARDVGVNSAHHQAANAVGNELAVVARAPDGIIEGLEARHHPSCIGVQWHPEVMLGSTPTMRRLFEGLIEAAYM
ncbi:MAG: gamma-glutamyl-gamma-aminobutyrate hydrolase family protein [Anaerolineae bacterium]|jgi:putative glutamine amidotransferase